MRRIPMTVVAVLFVLAAWEKAATDSSDVRFFVSSPSLTLSFALGHLGSLEHSAFTTAIEAVTGFALAILLSGIFLLACWYWPVIWRAILPLFVISQILPMITLAPLFIVLFGMGLISKIAMVVLMCFFPIFVNFSAGAESVSREVFELLYVYDTRPAFRIFRVVLPLSLPQGFAGLKVSTTMAVMGAVVAEFMGAYDGLGKNLYLAPKNSQPELMICSVILVTVLGFAFYGSTTLAERYICKWHFQKGGIRT